MKQTLLGLVVLGLVLAGVFWARAPQQQLSPSTASAGPEGPALRTASAGPEGPALRPASAGPEGPALPPSDDRRSPGASAPGTTPDDSTLPDVTVADAAIDLGDVRITLSVAPRPPVAFQTNRFRVLAESKGAPAALEGGRISFEMKMPMGDHRYILVPAGDRWHEAEVVLPFCPSGNPRWYATVEGSVAGRPRVAHFQVDLARPGSAR